MEATNFAQKRGNTFEEVTEQRNPAVMGTFCDWAYLYSAGQATNTDQATIPQFQPFRFIG
jgi:hypothetical protein